MVGTFSFDRVFISFRLQMVEAFLLLLLETRVEADEICDSLAGFYSTAKQCLDLSHNVTSCQDSYDSLIIR